MSDFTLRAIMWIIILILANGVYSLWKKQSWGDYIFRTLLFVAGSVALWII